MRVFAGRADYLTLVPNAPVSKTFNLAEDYALKAKGPYTVVFRGNLDLNKLPDSNVLSFEVR